MMQYVEWLNNLHFPPLSSPADSLHLDVAQMNELADANQILFVQLPDN